jgi:hypothetical protein
VYIYVILLLIPYLIEFIMDTINGRNGVLRRPIYDRPFHTGQRISFNTADCDIEVLAVFGTYAPALIGPELWQTGTRTIRQLRILERGFPHILISLPIYLFSDLPGPTYSLQAEYVLHYPRPLYGSFHGYIPTSRQRIPIVQCHLPSALSQRIRLSPWPHSIAEDFEGDTRLIPLRTIPIPSPESSISVHKLLPFTPTPSLHPSSNTQESSYKVDVSSQTGLVESSRLSTDITDQ